jgi:hypothetical protein
VEPREITFEEIAALEEGSIVTPSEGEFWPGGVTVPLAIRSLDPATRTMEARTGVTEASPHGVASVTVTFPPGSVAPEGSPQ